jgi:hypothetical protein
LKPRPIASVHLDIAELMARVSDIVPGPGQSLQDARAEWLVTWAKALSYREPSLHPYAAKLLEEAAQYQAEASEKKRQAANARWKKGSRHAK